MTEKLSERMSGGSFSPTNDGVLTCDECGREPDDLVFHCSSHEDLQHKKEAAALEQRVAKYVIERHTLWEIIEERPDLYAIAQERVAHALASQEKV